PHLLAVDERAEARLLVANDARRVLDADLGVDARDVGAGQTQIGVGAAADREQRLIDVDDTPAEGVGDDETGRGCGGGHEATDYNSTDSMKRSRKSPAQLG